MPGAKGNRTKGNVKPSSSSRAAELLTQSGAAPTGFIGFGSPAYVPASQVFDEVDTCLDSDFRVVLRKLTKRDATTKIKALGEFTSLCKEKDDSTLQAVLPFWPRLFNKLAIDIDPKVREYTQNAMAVLVGRVRRNLAPYLKNVMGCWVLSRNDTYPTVSSAAQKSFNAAFPPDKQESAMVFCKQAVLEYMIDNLLNQTAATLSDPKTTEKEEMESKFHRIQSSSLMGLRQLLLTLPTSHLDEGLRGHLRGLLNDGKFWNLSKSSLPQVRSGLFWMLGGLCQTVPDLAGEYVGKVSPLVLSSIHMLEPGITASVWDAVLSLVKFVPACWENINWQKAFWPKLKKLLESGCQGNAASVAPNLLPLLSCIPLDTAGGATTFFPKVLDLFKQGFAQDTITNSPSETNAWTKAFMECLQFALKQIGSEPSCQDVGQAILLDQLLPIIMASLSDPKPTLSRSLLYTLASAFLKTVASDTNTAKLAYAFWDQLSADIVGVFETIGSGDEQSVRPERLVAFVRSLLFHQDKSVLSTTKPERVRFAAEEVKPQVASRVSTPVEISEEVKVFVKTVIVQSHRLYWKDRQCVHLKLFTDLANMYFPVDIAQFVLHSLDSDGEKRSGGDNAEENSAGERTVGKGAREEAADTDPHTAVIDRVVLPVLGGREEEEESGAEVVEHTISLLFACLPYLSQTSSTDVWDSVLQNVGSTGALSSLIERALEKRQIMPQVLNWLSSPHLHSRLCDLVTMVTVQRSGTQSAELEQGWRVICLVLSANDDSEPVFPRQWIVDMVSRVHQELVTLASQPLEREQAQRAVQLVSRAALTFFQNLKMSLCMEEGRNVIVALLMAHLDCNLLTSGEAADLVRQSWTTGLGLAVQDTGGFIQPGGMLASICGIIQDTVLTKTLTMEQYKRVVTVTDDLLKTTQSHLPRADDSEEGSQTFNPVLPALLSELVVHPFTSVQGMDKILEYLSLTDQLPLTLLSSMPNKGQTNPPSLTAVVFSSLFNLHLLRCHCSGYRFDSEAGATEAAETFAWEGEEEVILNAVRSAFLASVTLQVESQVVTEIVGAIEELTVTAKSCFCSSSRSLQQQILSKAFVRINEDAVGAVIFQQLAHQQSQHHGRVDKEFFQQLHSENSESAAHTEALVSCLPQWIIPDICQLQAALFSSITAEEPTAAVSCLHLMAVLLRQEPTLLLSTYQDVLQGVASKMKTLRDESSALFLFSCDVCGEPDWKVAFNVSTMQFLTAYLNCDLCKLTADHWDFILCSTVAWIESVENSNMTLTSPACVQTFCVEACRLLATVAHTIHQKLPLDKGVDPPTYPPNLETEWKEFFAEGIYSFLFPIFIRLVEELKDSPRTGRTTVILRAVGSAMSQCPQDQVMDHHLPLKLSASDDTSPVPESLQTVLNHLCPVLTCVSAPAQLTAFALLDRIITQLPTYQKQQEPGASASEFTSSSDELDPRPPPAPLMKVIEDCATAMDVVLAPVSMESTVAMVPGSEEYQFALGYLLSWQLLLRFFHSASSAGRAEFASYLKKHSNVERLLSHLFQLMPHKPGSASLNTSLSKSQSDASPLKRSLCEEEGEEDLGPESVKRSAASGGAEDSWFGSPTISFTAADVGKVGDIQRASCSVYLHCLEVIPVLVRQWWKEQDRKSAAFVEKFTTKHASPQLIRSEMQSVSNPESAVQDLLVKANSITRQVTASYTTEELKAEIQITLPESYPLGEITVDSERHAVVKQARWERLLLQVNVFLQHQNGSIMEGLKLWKKNIDKRLEGVEECFICYAVIHATNLELPRVPCGTCKKKFHGACLYKWLNSSQNATCPLCRSPF